MPPNVSESKKSLRQYLKHQSLAQGSSMWHCPKQRHTWGFPGWAAKEALYSITLAQVFEGMMQEKQLVGGKEKK